MYSIMTSVTLGILKHILLYHFVALCLLQAQLVRVTRVRKASKPERISQRRVRPPENEELECNCKRRDADVAISKDIRKYILYIMWTTVLTADRTTKIGKKALNSDGEGGLGHLDDDCMIYIFSLL